MSAFSMSCRVKLRPAGRSPTHYGGNCMELVMIKLYKQFGIYKQKVLPRGQAPPRGVEGPVFLALK